MKAVILVGGEGTRLRPVTCLNPKPMLPLMNRPFMHNFISWLMSHGLKDIIFTACYLPRPFIDYFGKGEKFGIDIAYETEKVPLGTCGAVKNVEKYLKGSGQFMVFNGDILSSLDLTDMINFHKSKRADITISLTSVEDPTAYGLVPIDSEGRVREFLEKPGRDQIVTNLINAGTYIMEPRILDLAPAGKNYSFERGLFPAALEKGFRIYGYVSSAYWLDVGTPEKYLAAHHDIGLGKIEFDYPYPEIEPGIYGGTNVSYNRESFSKGPVVIGDNTVIEKGAKIEPLTTIGKNCHIASGARLCGCVIFNNCRIGKGSQVSGSIISNSVTLGNDVIVEGCSIIGDNTQIKDGNILKNGIKININSKIVRGQIFF
ncbi:MAG: NDP-sugar synthase [Actinobacteria bacterium]|nr:NDP-sugar synthase [Actinomycetota bacterium]